MVPIQDETDSEWDPEVTDLETDSDSSSVVKWRLVTPCGHWCCGTCVDRLIEEAAAAGKQLCCPECREVVRSGFVREWPGQVVVDEGEAGSVCSTSD